jgi:hypothetical protein
MVHVILICFAMVGDDGKPGAATSAPADRAAYQSADGKAGKDANAHVRLALWCEEHGLSAERVKHLALAIAYDPTNVLARGLAGLVAYHGKWKRPEDLKRDDNSDPARRALIREYLDRRARAPHTPDAQLKLAAWCAEMGLAEQATAHYTEVTRLDPTREAAWKHLGYKKQGKRWVKPEDAAAQKLEAERQKSADQHWKPRLEKLRDGLDNASASRRQQARDALAAISDPRALPAIMRVFGPGSERLQLVAVQLLSQIDGPAASFWLASLAVDCPSATVRQRASEALRRRDPRDVIGLLIRRVHKPYRYKVQPAQGPGSTGALMVDGEQFDVQRFYRMPDLDLRLLPPVTIGFEMPGTRNGVFTPAQAKTATNLISQETQLIAWHRQMMVAAAIEETRQADLAIQRTLVNDVRMLDELNVEINDTNDRVLPLLTALTGQALGADPRPWQRWWTDQLGLVLDDRYSDTKPTLTDTVARPDVILNLAPVNVQISAVSAHHSCFAAGTLVHTIDGPRPIESIQVGDSVLSQDTTTGALAIRPVVAVHVNKPNPTLKISLGQEAVVATGIHRFWQAGHGWTMARDLKAGDKLRTVGGIAPVESIEPGETVPVYNLDVADNRNFFVGASGLLVHDFTFVQPVAAPFDRLPESIGPASSPKPAALPSDTR